MGIIVIDNNKQSKILSNPDNYDAEKVLQNMIEENPGLLPFNKIQNENRKLVTVGKETQVKGRIDLILLDNSGNIYIIETKLDYNHDARNIIAQLIDYTSSLMYDDSSDIFISKLNKYCDEKYGKSLKDVLKDKFDDTEGVILKKILENYSDGKFFLIVAMDKVNNRIENMINCMNKGNFKVLGYELERYNVPEGMGRLSQIITPRIIGDESVARKGTDAVWDITEDEYLVNVEQLPEGKKKAVLYLFNHYKKNDKMKYAIYPNRFYAMYHDITKSTGLFNIYYDGRLEFCFNDMCNTDKGKRFAEKYVPEVNKLFGIYADGSKKPKVEIDLEKVEKFVVMLDRLIDEFEDDKNNN